MDKAIANQFLSLACQLSPECLTCDGELPRTLVQRRYRKLKSEWAALEAKVGRSVSEDEVWAERLGS